MEQAVLRPPSGWSILEVVEHLAISEEFLFSRLAAARESDGELVPRDRESSILERGLNRSRRVETPEVGRPVGRFATLAEAMAGFGAARAQTAEYVERFAGNPRTWLTDHPLIAGPVNCYEILLIIAVHPERHAEQIRKIRSLWC